MLIGLAAVLALALLLAWTRYDPVEGGDVTWCPQTSTLLPAARPTEGEESGVVCTVVNTEAGAVAFAATVRNSGNLPVIVREVRMRGEIAGVFRVEAVRMGMRNDPAVTSHELVPFEAFRLGPGQQRLVEVRGTLTPCEDVSSARVATVRVLPVRISVFGLPHDSEAALDPPVRLIAEGC
jgi:hypothetical protein